ncbi:putative replication O of prophage domain protein [Klebsiella aerogenes]|nr:putative replication O of prophage domain protein [Klebsiella aerogenes]
MQGRVLDGDYISGWDKRQVNKEDNGNISSTAKSPAERKRAERERKKQLLLNEKSHGESRGVTNESPEVTTDKDKDKDKDLYPPLSPPEGKTGKNKFDPLSVELPEWLSPALWAEWVGYRKQLGKPIKTQQGVSGSINKLSAYRDKGHSPEYVVKLTMENEWRGLLVPEGMTSNKPRDVNAISQPDGFIPKGFRG